jgi:hypothetical protein
MVYASGRHISENESRYNARMVSNVLVSLLLSRHTGFAEFSREWRILVFLLES